MDVVPDTPRLSVDSLLALRSVERKRDFNWHNSLGFWTAIPLFLIAGTGAFISYQWPGRWLDRIAGSPEERLAARQPVAPPREGGREAGGAERNAAERREGATLQLNVRGLLSPHSMNSCDSPRSATPSGGRLR